MTMLLNAREYAEIQAIIKNFGGNEVTSNHVLDIEEYEDGGCKVQVKEQYTETMYGIVRKYSGIVVPMICHIGEKLQEMSEEITELEMKMLDSSDDNDDPEE